MMSRISSISILFILFMTGVVTAQGFLHTSGKNIVDGSGDNFIIRSIGTGNWMLQEGYMMHTAGIAGTQWEFRKKLEELIGASRTETFYNYWLSNHLTRQDVDSLASWGFNTIRPALHYKWFTLPIEDEPEPTGQTWIEKGFALTDSLVKWCAANRMYVIFDMHGAPGGQGKNADISDYDPSKLSLWESEANKTKLVELWYKLASRYAHNPWVGGYDLINETNWEFPEGNNSQMMDLYKRITDTIRSVDQNHIIFIEGNSFANDFSGLTPPWDDNMVYSFHKYWSYNNENSLDWILSLRDRTNTPLWLGETGENSNTWYTNLISLAEANNIGWSWWPVKKMSVNNPLQVLKNEEYAQLVRYWEGEAEKPTIDEAFEAVMKLAEHHHIKNCIVQYDVLDAMFRQPYSAEVLPYKTVHRVDDVIFATDYDLGRNGYAYFDQDSSNYSIDTDEYVAWNAGYAYRNDGVDIEECTDSEPTNGYNVGWVEDGEWMVYSMISDSAVLADGGIRFASGTGNAVVVLEADGNVVSGNIDLGYTGGWKSWETASFKDVMLPEGEFKLKVRFSRGGANISYIKFENFRSPGAFGLKSQLCETSVYENDLFLYFNKEIDENELQAEEFSLKIGNDTFGFVSAETDTASRRMIRLVPAVVLPHSTVLKLSYSGSSVTAGDEQLEPFSDMTIVNKLYKYPTIPATLETESYIFNNGFVFEDCKDSGGGKNTAYANFGDYLDYIIHVEEEKEYLMKLRVALNAGNAVVKFQYESNGEMKDIKSMALAHTGGWQSWQTQETRITLPAGKYKFRILSMSGEHNINWFNFTEIEIVGAIKEEHGGDLIVFPNPVSDRLYIELNDFQESLSGYKLCLYESSGRLVKSVNLRENFVETDVSDYSPGVYFLQLSSDNWIKRAHVVIR